MERRIAVVVEDDDDIRGLMADLLGQSGFTVHQAASGAAGVAAVREHRPAVVTVDLGLPDFDGYEVTRQVRQFSDAYVVMLTARTEEIDTLLGLEAGADDYVTKPFRPRELRARIEAMLRRPRTDGIPVPPAASAQGVQSAPLAPDDGPAPTLPPVGPPASPPWSADAMSTPAHASAVRAPAGPGPGTPHSAAHPSAAYPSAAYPTTEYPSSEYPSAGPPSAVPPSAAPPSAPSATPAESAARARLELDGLVLYPHLHVVMAAQQEVTLTPTEFLLLETLLRSGQVVRSKAELARTVRGDSPDGGTFVSKSDERAVEVHIGNLRRKLADDPNEPRWLQTVRGVGYRMSGRPLALS